MADPAEPTRLFAGPVAEARRALDDAGFAVLRSVVPADDLAVVVRRLDMAVRHHSLTPEERADWHATGFFPHLRGEPEVWAVLPEAAPDILGWQEGDQWGEPQLLLRPPDQPARDPSPPWTDDHAYRGIVCVPLTASGPSGSGLVGPGDALLVHPERASADLLDLGPAVGMAVYFRLVAATAA